MIVSNNIPVDPACGNYERSKPVRVPAPSPHSQTSPTRPSSLPIISEPRPVPTMGSRKMSQPQSPPKNISNAIPRSQPINMRSNRENRNGSNCDISSISPPAVQFAIGTPPSGTHRRRSQSETLSETPPPPCQWQVSPASHQSPLRHSGTSSPILPTALSKLPPLSSPTLISENNNHPLHARAFTLPDMGTNPQLQSLLHEGGTTDDHPITFRAPELPAETLLDVSFSLNE